MANYLGMRPEDVVPVAEGEQGYFSTTISGVEWLGTEAVHENETTLAA